MSDLQPGQSPDLARVVDAAGPTAVERLARKLRSQHLHAHGIADAPRWGLLQPSEQQRWLDQADVHQALDEPRTGTERVER